MIACSELRIKFDKLKDDKYWNYYLLQPFPGMKILKTEEFKLKLELKLKPSEYLLFISKSILNSTNKVILTQIIKYIIGWVKKPDEFDKFIKKCRQLYRNT